MSEEIINQICNEVFQKEPVEIIRNTVGLAAYVYTVCIDDVKYVIKTSDDKNLIAGSTYWLHKIKDLDIPTPKVIAENVTKAPYYFVMSFIPGKDLGIVYSKLSKDEKKAIAKKIIKYQKEIKKLSCAEGFGSLNSYEDFENRKASWEENILCDIQRAENGISKNKIFSTDYVQRLKKLIPLYSDYFSTIKPEPFLDDITTKNVLIEHGKLSGIIDLDWITFGDEVYFLGLVTMALLSMNADLDYAEYLKQEMCLNEQQAKVLNLYVLVFCVIFMSEKGERFNQNEQIAVSEEEKNRLERIFEEYYKRMF